jgi:5-hydroxyisourate hydrolase-like protein (transthyretin family)
VGISICVIDSVRGCAVPGMPARLTWTDSQGEREVVGHTDAHGRVARWEPKLVITRGVYRLELDLDAYYVTIGLTPFLPAAGVSFRILNPQEDCIIDIATAPASTLATCHIGPGQQPCAGSPGDLEGQAGGHAAKLARGKLPGSVIRLRTVLADGGQGGPRTG